MQLNTDQANALDEILTWANDDMVEPTMSLTGPAGTGKTTLMAELIKKLRSSAWTAMTGKAARRLSEVGVGATTLHSQLYWPPSQSSKQEDPRFENVRPPPADVVVIDEASMVTPQIYEHLQEWLQHGTKILFVGDPYQLPPILSKQEEKTYGEFFTVFSEVKGPYLSQVMRSDDDVIWAATILREEHRLPTQSRGGYEFRAKSRRRTIILDAVTDYFDDPDDHVILAWRNKLRMKANGAIRHVLGYADPLPQVAEPVLFAKNGQGVLNGDVAVMQALNDGPQIADVLTHELTLDNGQCVRVSLTGRDEPMDGFLPKVQDWSDYRRALGVQAKKDPERGHANRLIIKEPVPLTYAYALTGHKAQGSEWRRVTIMMAHWEMDYKPFLKKTLLPTGEEMIFALRWLYTAITRAKTQVTVIVGSDGGRS